MRYDSEADREAPVSSHLLSCPLISSHRVVQSDLESPSSRPRRPQRTIQPVLYSIIHPGMMMGHEV